jgi:hypothetical protein
LQFSAVQSSAWSLELHSRIELACQVSSLRSQTFHAPVSFYPNIAEVRMDLNIYSPVIRGGFGQFHKIWLIPVL